jgi:hypothetical protein
MQRCGGELPSVDRTRHHHVGEQQIDRFARLDAASEISPAMAASSGRSATASSSTSAVPMMTVRILLKSRTMPPASRLQPRADRYCRRRRFESDVLRMLRRRQDAPSPTAQRFALKPLQRNVAQRSLHHRCTIARPAAKAAQEDAPICNFPCQESGAGSCFMSNTVHSPVGGTGERFRLPEGEGAFGLGSSFTQRIFVSAFRGRFRIDPPASANRRSGPGFRAGRGG